MDIYQKNLTPHPPSFMVVQGYWIWNQHGSISLPHDFPLVFHGSISYRFRDKWPHLPIFPTPGEFNAPAGGSPWNFVTAVGSNRLC